MLLCAAASRWHWGRVGGAQEVAVADWQITHVASLLGLADLALLFAARSLRAAEREGWGGRRLASAHEGMSRACAPDDDAAGRERHVEAAHAALADEPDEEDRTLIAGQLASVPPAGPVGRSGAVNIAS
jgi:hypothetical protein